MPFSHHSHSGEFCGHAKNTLEECIQQAIKKGLRVFALTEHMPRDEVRDLYSEEVEMGMTSADLFKLFDDFYHAALEMREKYADDITILVGFEIDWIRAESINLIKSIQAKYPHDLFVGSVHHVNGIPVDYSKKEYAVAIISAEETRKAAGSSATGEEALFEQYFEDQYAMLSALKPKIVGHFDLIRLLCSDYKFELKNWKSVWEKVERNVKFIAEYGGLVEFNSAALRKGWTTPYPGRDVSELMVSQGVKFALSDDSHGVDQIAYGFDDALKFARDLKLEKLHYYHWQPLSRDILSGKLVQEESAEIKLPIVGDVSMQEYAL